MMLSKTIWNDYYETPILSLSQNTPSSSIVERESLPTFNLRK